MASQNRKRATYALGLLLMTFAIVVALTTLACIGFALGMRALGGNDYPASFSIAMGFAGGPYTAYKIWTDSGIDERIRHYLNLRRSAS